MILNNLRTISNAHHFSILLLLLNRTSSDFFAAGYIFLYGDTHTMHNLWDEKLFSLL